MERQRSATRQQSLNRSITLPMELEKVPEGEGAL
jgi:hypothetical protein